MSHKYKAGFLLNICVLMLCVLTLCMFGCGKEQPDADLSETEQITEPAEEDSIYITLYLYDESEDVPESTEGQKSDPNGVEGMNAVMVSTIGKDQLSAETIVSEYNRLIIASSYDEPLTVNEVRESGSQVWVDFDSESVKALQEKGKSFRRSSIWPAASTTIWLMWMIFISPWTAEKISPLGIYGLRRTGLFIPESFLWKGKKPLAVRRHRNKHQVLKNGYYKYIIVKETDAKPDKHTKNCK